MSNTPVTEALRAIRERAGVGVREMARRLGMTSPSSYSHYEDAKRFKDDYLPMSWAIRFADALEPSGVDRTEVIALAGVDSAKPPPDVDERISQLSPRRKEMLMSLLADLEAAEALDLERQEKASGDAN
ncbi:helix-turn-helix domain-containing protein [Paracoccus shanxieyensis]|nr:helix-turn-helix transcriptional regulator [Paracoccus shanxieyensis]